MAWGQALERLVLLPRAKCHGLDDPELYRRAWGEVLGLLREVAAEPQRLHRVGDAEVCQMVLPTHGERNLGCQALPWRERSMLFLPLMRQRPTGLYFIIL